jgi:hypothetical protein
MMNGFPPLTLTLYLLQIVISVFILLQLNDLFNKTFVVCFDYFFGINLDLGLIYRILTFHPFN